MIIELSPPFSNIWSKGYLVVNTENRTNVCLVSSDIDRTTISYARYLMCVKLGYILDTSLEVDHIDEDKTNDSIDNLQVLTKAANIAKSNSTRVINYSFICCICIKSFNLTGKQLGQRRDKVNPTCSKICGYKKVSNTLKSKTDR